MAKTFTGGALIAYGPTLPPAGSTPDGALFYKTDSVSGGSQGLYMYGFIRDNNAGVLGPQVTQGWFQTVAPDLFVQKGGDVMTGSLTVPGVLKVTQTSGAQRILIGNQDSSGANNPVILEGANGAVTIGNGSNWTTGGTLGLGLSIAPDSGDSGLTWRGGQVWHSGNDGSGSTLDADLLDGQEGTYYRNLDNMNAGTLDVNRGGTGRTTTTTGGVAYGLSSTQYGFTAVGTSGYLLQSAGTGAPTWVNPTSLTVGTANFATSAGSATTATNATNATNASNVPWTGVTGKPVFWYDFGNAGSASPGPTTFPDNVLSGFDGYYTSDIGQYQVGMTISGSGSRRAQVAFNWNFEEGTPSGMRFRVNDDTGTTSAWGPFVTVWDQSNLTNLSQLTNGPGYLTNTTGDARYLRLTGGSLSGSLSVNGITLHQSNSLIQTTGSISALGNLVSTGGDVICQNGEITNQTGGITSGIIGSTGSIKVRLGSASRTGYIEYFAANGTRQGYMGYSASTGAQDAGTLNYVAGAHSFTGSITSTGNVTAFSDARLKTNVATIENAVDKVMQVRGVTYDRIDSAHGTRETGVIAQELEAVLPEAVVTNDEGIKSVAYGNVVGLLIEAIKEQQKQIEALKAALAKVVD